VQSPASFDILSIVASPNTLTDNAGTAPPWDVTITVENTGQSAARLTLPAGLTVAVQSAPGAVFDPVNSMEEGGDVLAGGATGTLVAHFDAAPDFLALGTRTVGATINGVELNSNGRSRERDPGRRSSSPIDSHRAEPHSNHAGNAIVLATRHYQPGRQRGHGRARSGRHAREFFGRYL
jgi:hypothetical protein